MTRGYRKESLDVLSQELRSALLNLFGSNHGIYRLLGLDQIVAWPTFRRAMTGRTIRLSKGRAIRQRWSDWRNKFLKEPDFLDFELRTPFGVLPSSDAFLPTLSASTYDAASTIPESSAPGIPAVASLASDDCKQFEGWDSQ
jgi:hypothetical protein